MRIVVVGPRAERSLQIAEAWSAYVRETGYLHPGGGTRWRVRLTNRVAEDGDAFRFTPAGWLTTLDPIVVSCYSFDGVLATGEEGGFESADAVVVVGEGQPNDRWQAWQDRVRSRLRSRKLPSAGGRIGIPVVVVSPVDPTHSGVAPPSASLDLLTPLVADYALVRETGVVLPPTPGAPVAASPDLAAAICSALKEINPLCLHPHIAGAVARTPAPWLLSYSIVLWGFGVLAPSLPLHVARAVCATFGWSACARSAGEALVEVPDFGLWLVLLALALSGGTALLWQLRSRSSPRVGFSWWRRVASGAIAGAWLSILLPRSGLLAAVAALRGIGASLPESLPASALDAADWRLPSTGSALVVSLLVLTMLRIEVWRLPRRLYRARQRVLDRGRTGR